MCHPHSWSQADDFEYLHDNFSHLCLSSLCRSWHYISADRLSSNFLELLDILFGPSFRLKWPRMARLHSLASCDQNPKVLTLQNSSSAPFPIPTLLQFIYWQLLIIRYFVISFCRPTLRAVEEDRSAATSRTTATKSKKFSSKTDVRENTKSLKHPRKQKCLMEVTCETISTYKPTTGMADVFTHPRALFEISRITAHADSFDWL